MSVLHSVPISLLVVEILYTEIVDIAFYSHAASTAKKRQRADTDIKTMERSRLAGPFLSNLQHPSESHSSQMLLVTFLIKYGK